MVSSTVKLSVAQMCIHHQSIVLHVCWYRTASASNYRVQANYANIPMFAHHSLSQLFTIHTFACATGVLSDTYTAVFLKAVAGAQQLNPSIVVSDFESRHRSYTIFSRDSREICTRRIS